MTATGRRFPVLKARHHPLTWRLGSHAERMLLSICDQGVSTGAAAGALRGIASLRAPSGDVSRVPRGESRTPTVTGDSSRPGARSEIVVNEQPACTRNDAVNPHRATYPLSGFVYLLRNAQSMYAFSQFTTRESQNKWSVTKGGTQTR